MENEELKDQAKKVASEAAEVAKEAADKAREFAERTFTHENAEALKQNAAKLADDAKEFAKRTFTKENASKLAGNAKDFAKKTFTKENAERAQKAARDELEKLKTAEGREEAKAKLITKAGQAKVRIVGMWESGTKGKCILIAAGVFVLIVLKSCLFTGSGDGAPGVAAVDGGDVHPPMKFIERCQYCFHEKISGMWEQPPPCKKGRGHSYETIGTSGDKHYGCSKCGRHYYLQHEPRGYIHCPCGQACQWRGL